MPFDKDWDVIAEVLTEAADIFREEGADEWRRETLPILALSLYAKTETEWIKAIEYSREALPLLVTPEHSEERACVLKLISLINNKVIEATAG